MKFKIHVKDERLDWWEDYNEDTDNPQKWAEELVQKFNNSLRPMEKPRTLIDIEVIK